MAAMRSIALALVLVGCTTTESENVDTDALWPRFQVAHDDAEDTVAVQAMLRVGGPTGTVVELTGDDHFEVNGVRMTDFVEEVTNYHWSVAAIDPTPDRLYTIVLIRPGEEIATTVEVPALPVITATEPAGTVEWNEPLTVSWDASDPGDGVSVKIEGDCVMGQNVSNLPDNGSYTTMPLQDGGSPNDCDIDVVVTRGFTRGVSSAYQGGWSETYRADSQSIQYDSLAGP